MPRRKEVVIAGKNIIINEQKIGYIQDVLLPKIEPAWDAIFNGEVVDLISNLGKQINEIFPELREINIKDCYPSEMEEFVGDWTDVNFIGIKRLYGQVQSFAKKVQQMLELDAARRSDNQNTGED